LLRQQKNGFAQRTKKQHITSRLKREAATEITTTSVTEPNQPAGLAGVEKPKKNSLQPKDIPPSNLPNKTSVV